MYHLCLPPTTPLSIVSQDNLGRLSPKTFHWTLLQLSSRLWPPKELQIDIWPKGGEWGRVSLLQFPDRRLESWCPGRWRGWHTPGDPWPHSDGWKEGEGTVCCLLSFVPLQPYLQPRYPNLFLRLVRTPKDTILCRDLLFNLSLLLARYSRHYPGHVIHFPMSINLRIVICNNQQKVITQQNTGINFEFQR